MPRRFATLMRCFLIVLILTGADLLTGQIEGREVSGKPSSLCYAFLRDGDLWTVCQGTRERIDLHGKALDFAVSTDGSEFIAVWEKAHPKNSTQAPDSEMLLLPLKGNIQSVVRDWPFDLVPGRLHASCGGIITISRDPALQGRLGLAYDVMNGQLLNASSYKSLHCSADRHATAGWNAEEPSLYVNTSKERTLQAARWQDFDVSPLGKYVAYFRENESVGMELCVAENSREPACVPEPGQAYMLGRVSVSDSMQVIYEGSGEAHCYYHDSQHYTQKAFRHALEDPCPAILYQPAGQTKPAILETMGDHPQWITPEAATALHRWNIGRNTSQKKIP